MALIWILGANLVSLPTIWGVFQTHTGASIQSSAGLLYAQSTNELPQRPVGMVNDFGNLLTNQEEAILEQKLRNYRDTTSFLALEPCILLGLAYVSIVERITLEHDNQSQKQCDICAIYHI